MILGRIKGNIVATAKYPSFLGHRLLVVQPIDEYGSDTGTSFLACDSVTAAPGDVVLVEREGNSARQILGAATAPFHAVIVAIVDKVTTK